MINTTVRFFSYCIDSNDELTTCEISEATFIRLHNAPCEFEYERHTMHDNGVNQICLTINPNNDYPRQSDIEFY